MTIDEFKNVDLRVAKILEASRVEGSDKLLKLAVSLGEEKRSIIAGIGKAYELESLVGTEIIIVANLDYRKFHITVARNTGSEKIELESQGMLLAASGGDELPVLLRPEKNVEPGSRIR